MEPQSGQAWQLPARSMRTLQSKQNGALLSSHLPLPGPVPCQTSNARCSPAEAWLPGYGHPWRSTDRQADCRYFAFSLATTAIITRKLIDFRSRKYPMAIFRRTPKSMRTIQGRLTNS